MRRAESAKKKQEEMRRAESAKKQEGVRRTESARRAESSRRAESAKKKQQSPSRASPLSPRTPPQKKSPPRAFFTPSSRKFTDANRAAVYGQGRKANTQKLFADIERQKMACRRRGMTYNPITKQCSYKSPAVSSGGACRIDCAKIGKKCGPSGKCVKL